jgi:hypothetical protein
VLIKRLIALEADVAYREPACQGEPEFQYEVGKIPVLISAPHGAVHWREGAEKSEDEFTAGLARLAGELSGAHVLYARRRSNTDPNWDTGVPFKMRMAEIVSEAGIRFVLDLHGAANRRPFGIALGTMRGESCPRQRPAIIRAFSSAGFQTAGQGQSRLDLDRFFTAIGKDGQETVTRYAWTTLGIPAAQVEIHECLRVAAPRADASSPVACLAQPEAIERIIAALVAVVLAVDSDN